MLLPPEIGPSEILRFRQDQFRDLRVELGQLKTCQSSAILWGVTGTTAIIGLLKVADTMPFEGLLMLIPLAILFPSWLIFFDKARTIARINAFLRVQEDLATQGSEAAFFGWESALAGYWGNKQLFSDKKAEDPKENAVRKENADRIRKHIASAPKNRKKLSSYTYWITTYAIFVSLSIVCLLLSAITIKKTDLVQFVVIFDVVSILLCGIAIIFHKRMSFSDLWTGLLFLIFGLALAQSAVIAPVYANDYQTTSAVYVSGTTAPSNLSPVFEDVVNMVGFIVSLMVFLCICLCSFYILYNLIYGRYMGCAYDCRWRIILDAMDKRKIPPVASGLWPIPDPVPQGKKSIFDKLIDLTSDDLSLVIKAIMLIDT